ncbi:MAG: DMT family transporter [Chloroflexota bacterium]
MTIFTPHYQQQLQYRWLDLLKIFQHINLDKRWVSWGLAIMAITAYSTSAPVTRGAIEGGLHPTSLITARYLITTLLLGATLALTAPTQLKIDRRGLLVCAIVGSFNGLTTLAFAWSLTRLSSSMASMLVSVYPLIVLSLLALRGEKFTYRNTIRLIIGLSGIYFIVGPGGQADTWGIFLIMTTAAGYAVQLVLTQWYLSDYDVRTVAFYVIGFMTLIVLSLWFIQGVEWQAPTRTGWMSILWLAVIGTYLARLAMFAGIRGIGSGQTSLLAPTETFLTVLWSIIFLQEVLTPIQWVGSILIIISGLLAIKRMGRVKPQPIRRTWLRL